MFLLQREIRRLEAQDSLRYTRTGRKRKQVITEDFPRGGGGGVTLGISRWGCAAGTLEPLAYTRASSAEFCYPILEQIPPISV